MRIQRIAILFLTGIIALALCGVGYAMWDKTIDVGGTAQMAEKFDCGFTACSTNDPPGTIDPGKDKDVGCAIAELASPEDGDYEQVIVTIDNAYPCYECEVSVTVHNDGTIPARVGALDITSPPEVTVEHIDFLGVVLAPDESVEGRFWVHLEQEALQAHTYYFTVEIGMTMWHTGTIGFWKNWTKHHTKPSDLEHLQNWLISIDDDSDWLGPTTVTDMVTMLEEASGGTDEQKFLGHYLAQRLNLEAGRQGWDTTHNITGIDGYEYLGLSDPESATAQQIVNSIEAKYDTGPTDAQFNTMKTICDALNNLSI